MPGFGTNIFCISLKKKNFLEGDILMNQNTYLKEDVVQYLNENLFLEIY